MSAPSEGAKPTVGETVTSPESPTTARPLEMDDDDVQETIPLNDEAATPVATTTGPTATSDAPPPKPPRPMTETQRNEQILKEAFPSVDLAVIKAVLSASAGRIDPAFNALLQMTDPEAAAQDVPPPPPPRPSAHPEDLTSTAQSQLEADEQYARQLAEHYENAGAYEDRTSNRGPGVPRGRQQTGLKPNEMYDREHSFIDDDLPVIRENLKKGFLETQTKVNSWFNDFKKKLNEQFDENDDEHAQAGSSAFMGRPTRDQTRRSNDYDRYDADPELLSDDFAGMKFNADGTPANARPLGGSNPNAFRPPAPSKSPKPGDARKVAFSDNVEDINAYDASPRIPPKDATSPGSTAKASKWQPLSTIDPSPIAENDPFSLGDSEDEKDAKDKGGKGEIKLEDSERLRQAAAEAMADSLVDDKAKAGEAAAKKE